MNYQRMFCSTTFLFIVALICVMSFTGILSAQTYDGLAEGNIYLPSSIGTASFEDLSSASIVPSADDQEPPHVANLKAKARAEGSVRVIVELAMPNALQRESALGEDAVARQRSTIRATQQQFIDGLPNQAVNVRITYKTIPYLALTVEATHIESVLDSPAVVAVQEDRWLERSLASSTAVIGAPTVWNAGFDGAGQTVVVIDDGIDADHPFFGNRVVDEACFSSIDDSVDAISLCPNGTAEQIGSGSADVKIPACNGGNLCVHGTYVTGIAAGNGSSFSGVARGADIIAIQVFTRFDDNAFCSARGKFAPCFFNATSDLIRGLEHVSQLAGTYSIAAVNMSLVGESHTDQAACDNDNSATKIVIDILRNQGIPSIVSSGNAGSTNAISEPACISSAIAVGATTDNDLLAPFSSMSNLVELLAPGMSIDSSVPNNGFSNAEGTSAAAPHVAGAWAVFKQNQPSASISQVLSHFQGTGVSVSDNRPDGNTTKSRIQLDGALGIVPVTDTPTPIPTPTTTLTAAPITDTPTPTPTLMPSVTASNTPTEEPTEIPATNTPTPYISPTSTPYPTSEPPTPTNTPAMPTPTPTSYATPHPTLCDGVNEIHHSECTALVALYNSTNGMGWDNRTNWLQTTTPCSWFGVRCRGSHVIGLELNHNGLNGEIPTAIGNWGHMEYLNLARNHLHGSLPSTIGELGILNYLFIQENQLSGPLPVEMGQMGNLMHLFIYQNLFSGPVPMSLTHLTDMERFSFHDTSLCEPSSALFQTWLDGIDRLQRTDKLCD